MTPSQAEKTIQNALDAAKTVQGYFLQRLRSDDVAVQEEIKQFLRNIFFGLDPDNSEELVNLETLMTSANELVAQLVSPHQREMRSVQHQQLSKLAELSLDDYCRYCDSLERSTTDFMVSVNELIQQQTIRLMPELLSEFEALEGDK